MLFLRDVRCVWGRLAPLWYSFVLGVRSIHCFYMCYILWLQCKILGCINDALIIHVLVCDHCLCFNCNLIHCCLSPVPLVNMDVPTITPWLPKVFFLSHHNIIDVSSSFPRLFLYGGSSVTKSSAKEIVKKKEKLTVALWQRVILALRREIVLFITDTLGNAFLLVAHYKNFYFW